MILKQYWDFIYNMITGTSSGAYGAMTWTNALTATDGETTSDNIYYAGEYVYGIDLKREVNIELGTGDTAVTVNDTGLDDPLTSSSITITQVYTRTKTNDSVSVTGAVTVENITQEDIVVKEIMLTHTYQQNSPNATFTFAFYREVLETPITIPAGGSKALTVSWMERVYNS